MTKTEVKERLEAGETLESFLGFVSGQECDIFKEDEFHPGDELMYIPDLYLNQIYVDKDLSEDHERLKEILDCCYTGNDFIEVCDGNADMAERLFWLCDWQHPSTALEGVIHDIEEEQDES